ncbi:unnamed protein product, partial [Closterium sp. NIES-53]
VVSPVNPSFLLHFSSASPCLIAHSPPLLCTLSAPEQAQVAVSIVCGGGRAGHSHGVPHTRRRESYDPCCLGKRTMNAWDLCHLDLSTHLIFSSPPSLYTFSLHPLTHPLPPPFPHPLPPFSPLSTSLYPFSSPPPPSPHPSPPPPPLLHLTLLPQALGDKAGVLRWWDVASGAAGTHALNRGAIRRLRFAPTLDEGEFVPGAMPSEAAASLQVLEMDWLPLQGPSPTGPSAARQLLCVAAADGTVRLLDMAT